jgi:hypothetical protein
MILYCDNSTQNTDAINLVIIIGDHAQSSFNEFVKKSHIVKHSGLFAVGRQINDKLTPTFFRWILPTLHCTRVV